MNSVLVLGASQLSNVNVVFVSAMPRVHRMHIKNKKMGLRSLWANLRGSMMSPAETQLYSPNDLAHGQEMRRHQVTHSMAPNFGWPPQSVLLLEKLKSPIYCIINVIAITHLILFDSGSIMIVVYDQYHSGNPRLHPFFGNTKNLSVVSLFTVITTRVQNKVSTLHGLRLSTDYDRITLHEHIAI